MHTQIGFCCETFESLVQKVGKRERGEESILSDSETAVKGWHDVDMTLL